MAGEIETLDLRQVAYPERLPTILSAWKGRGAGQTLRIINDHDPTPLRYLFQGEFAHQFQWEYEKEGPQEWVVRIRRIAPAKEEGPPVKQDGEREALKEMLRKLHHGGQAAEIKEEAKDLLKNLDARKLALLEQELIQEGMGREEIRKLCDVHLEVMREALDKGKGEVEPGHPIHTLMEEHKVIKEYLEELRAFLKKLQDGAGPEDLSWEKPREVAQQLMEAEKHHQREEEVLFPELEKRGVVEPPQIMRLEHEDLRARKKTLKEVSQNPERYSYGELVKHLGEAGDYLVRELPNHIYKEDNILYQIALQVLDKEEWTEIKKRCDRIGYPFFTPVG